MPRTLLLILILAIALPAQARAESDSYGTTPKAYGSAASGLSNGTTNALIRELKRDFKRCFRLDKPYRYDCYDDAYFRSAARLDGKPAYATVQKALSDVGIRIGRIVERNLDPAAPVIRRGRVTYRPIKPSELPAAKAEVIAAIEEAQTVLLRSPDAGGHFQRIAAALDSNKVLLRSALLIIGRILRVV